MRLVTLSKQRLFRFALVEVLEKVLLSLLTCCFLQSLHLKLKTCNRALEPLVLSVHLCVFVGHFEDLVGLVIAGLLKLLAFGVQLRELLLDALGVLVSRSCRLLEDLCIQRF